jgi:hypothetical protein
MNYTIYIKNTGEIVNVLFCNNISEQQISDLHDYVEGTYDHNSYYIQNKTPILIPNKPEGKYYVFDFVAKQWVLDSNLAIKDVLPKRNSLLYTSDWTQIPNNPLTNVQQQAWATYRQELRDIPSQSGYPFNVIWPTPPQG